MFFLFGYFLQWGQTALHYAAKSTSDGKEKITVSVENSANVNAMDTASSSLCKLLCEKPVGVLACKDSTYVFMCMGVCGSVCMWA